MELQASQLAVEGDFGMSCLLLPSPQSEVVTHEMEELSLQPLPPLNERKNVLQLRLQQRRTREQLVDQGIMPSLKSPAAFHGQIRSLERARTENFLKHKIRSRPERAELIRMHILQETGAEPSLQATQMRLKRARLADNLNEMISQRPGPMELVEKNILPVDSSVKQAIIVGQVNYPKVLEEDSSEALSPEQPASQESQASVPSPAESRVPETPPPAPSFPNTTKATTDFMKLVSAIETPRPAVTQPPTPHKPAPTLVKQSQQKSPSEKSRSKKNKEPKSRVKKLKYHQYVPPDQKLEASEDLMDSSYTILPAPLKPVAEGQSSIMVSLAPPSSSDAPSALRPNNSLSNRKPGVLPANLEEMKVAELKLELKLRGLPVSGTKTDLIERLKPFQENHNTSAPSNNSISTTNMQMEVKTSVLSPHENMNPTSPLSPIPSERSTQDGGKPETPSFETHMVTSNWTPTFQSFQIPQEKDRRLHEKEQQIVELMKKLEQEQKLVEELKMQLEVEKRGCSADSPTVTSLPAVNLLNSNVVKMEGALLSNCASTTATIPNQILGSTPLSPRPTVVKLEDLTTQQFFISHQGRVVPQTLLTSPGQAGTQILLPVSLPSNATAIQLPSNTVSLQPVLQTTAQNPGLVHASGPQLQTTKMDASPRQQLINNNNSLLQTLTMCNNSSGLENQARPDLSPQSFLRSSPDNRVSPRASPNNHTSNGPLSKSPSPQPTFILQHNSLVTQPPKTKEPPRYEDAIKQSRNIHFNNISQVPTATSQQMDDLFDILIESGEITPFTQQDPQVSLSKTLPVTANIFTLPVSTAVCRPPPQVQVAPPPVQSPLPLCPSLSSLATDHQLEAFLEKTLAETSPVSDPRTRGLMEELQAQLMEQQIFSPMDTSDLSFCDSSSPSSLHLGLSDAGLDNMEWLDLTHITPGSAGVLTPLGIPSDFLDPQDLQLHWE
ncbi:hypothetical protein JOQ06_026811 [Pogonophryne albipinna]|uniref:SAP domain-containing protein n=1 Tax=Pogonophryne albipinna TaxID=1090488 RepID=A0AAD6BBS2_9TELE|nr:hypothetical protein JOQ06_026811 [Pogonophryne albipinna]